MSYFLLINYVSPQHLNGSLWKLHHREGYHEADRAFRTAGDEIEWKHTKDHLRYIVYREFNCPSPTDNTQLMMSHKILMMKTTGSGTSIFFFLGTQTCTLERTFGTE